MRKQHDDFCAFATHFVDYLLHVFFFDAKGPVFDHVARVGDGRIRKRLANNGDRDPIHLSEGISLKNGIPKICRFDVLR